MVLFCCLHWFTHRLIELLFYLYWVIVCIGCDCVVTALCCGRGRGDATARAQSIAQCWAQSEPFHWQISDRASKARIKGQWLVQCDQNRVDVVDVADRCPQRSNQSQSLSQTDINALYCQCNALLATQRLALFSLLLHQSVSKWGDIVTDWPSMPHMISKM